MIYIGNVLYVSMSSLVKTCKLKKIFQSYLYIFQCYYFIEKCYVIFPKDCNAPVYQVNCKKEKGVTRVSCLWLNK